MDYFLARVRDGDTFLVADFSGAPSENAANSFASAAPPCALCEMARTVSSPAIVPIKVLIAPRFIAESNELANS